MLSVQNYKNLGSTRTRGYRSLAIAASIPPHVPAVAEPDEYAARVLEVIEERGSHGREKLLKLARRSANEAQRQALKTSPRKR
jgi:hypothetical protein